MLKLFYRFKAQFLQLLFLRWGYVKNSWIYCNATLSIFCIIACLSYFNVNAQTKKNNVDDSAFIHNSERVEDDLLKGQVTEEGILYLNPLVINEDSITAWKQSRQFAYAKNLDSLLKIKQKEQEAARRPGAKGSPGSFLQKLISSGFLTAIFWTFVISIILYIVNKLYLNKGVFSRRKTLLPVKELAEQENLPDEPADYDALVNQSFKLEDYRMALRYLFLKTLKLLKEKGLIQLATGSTNHQLVAEIQENKRNEFASLVLNYEFVWYGHLKLSREQFEMAEKKFTLFINKIG